MRAGGVLHLNGVIENNSNNALTLISPDSFTDTGSFHHVALTCDGATAAFYVDGVLKQSAAFSGTIHDITSPFLIGKRDSIGIDGQGDTINGLVDEVEVFNRGLSQTEIQAIFNAGSAGKCKPSACTLTCPANIIRSNDSNQCGAITTYSMPTTSGTCGTVQCSPASGSFFPKGTTTVT